MYHFIVNEFVVGNRWAVRIQECGFIVVFQPRLAVIGAFFVEYHIDCIVAFLGVVGEIDDFFVCEILLEFGGSRCAETFEIFRRPAFTVAIFGRFAPTIVFALMIEQAFLLPFCRA